MQQPFRIRARAGFFFALAIALTLLPAIAPMAQAQTYSVIYAFPVNASHGSSPDSTLVIDENGNLYGTTVQGGRDCNSDGLCGTVFKVLPSGEESTLHSFNRASSGTYPGEGLFRDQAGNLYGTAVYGGIFDVYCQPNGALYGCGTVFKIDTSNRLTVLHRFVGGTNGWNPFGITGDVTGNLYGVTAAGGINCADGQGTGCGVIFKIDSAGKFSVLYRFAGGSDGSFPGGPLVLDSQGNLYGTASRGGQINPDNGYCFAGCGIIFKIDQAGNKSTLYEFTGDADGATPTSGLLRDPAGNLYGTTSGGGSVACIDGCGVIFKLDPSGKESVLYSFLGGTDGQIPMGGLIRDTAGTLYGTTSGGGASCDRYGDTCGVVYKLDISGQQTVLHVFHDQSDGGYPGGGLTMDAEGNLYGTTSDGGNPGDYGDACVTGCGVVFKITPPGAPPDSLKLTAVAYPTPPAEGGLLAYAFKIRNTGTIEAEHERLTTQVPAGTTFSSIEVSGNPAVSSCSTPAIGERGPVVCSENSVMRPGSTWTIRLTTQVTASAGTVIHESATASAENVGSSSASIYNTVH
jgi:uncharacterized repeat protein (TIGR03803 family)